MSIDIEMFMNQQRGLWEFCGLKFRVQSLKVNDIGMHYGIECIITYIRLGAGRFGQSWLRNWPATWVTEQNEVTWVFQTMTEKRSKFHLHKPSCHICILHWCLAPVHLAPKLLLKRLGFAQFSIVFNVKVVIFHIIWCLHHFFDMLLVF